MDNTIDTSLYPLKIAGLNAMLIIREFEAMFCDVGMGFKNSDSRARFRADFVPKIEHRNAITCLKIADLYLDCGNRKKANEYFDLAEEYSL